MRVHILKECGYDIAALGMSLSFKDRAIPVKEWWTKERIERIKKTLTANAGRGKGHDKFLRQIIIYMSIEAPRYWWSEFDTYKVGTVAQSESTMHTIMKRDLTKEDFANEAAEPAYLCWINSARQKGLFDKVKQRLLESYLQRRIVSLNYAVLDCIIKQRSKHKLPEWRSFIQACYGKCEHPELLPSKEDMGLV